MSRTPFDRRIKSVACHEAGHAVAFLCDLQSFEYVTIAPPQPHVRTTFIYGLDDLTSQCSAIVGLLAGCAAQAVAYKQSFTGLLFGSGGGLSGDNRSDW